ncbi:hypothetical protein HHI36_006273, partial [Cryptolaemus montrouzieri]
MSNKIQPSQDNLNENRSQTTSTRQAQNQEIRGTGRGSANFNDTQLLAWIHVGRASTNNANVDVFQHLKEKFSSKTFSVEKPPQRENARSVSHRVVADLDTLDALFQPENRPDRINVSRFKFFRSKRSRTGGDFNINYLRNHAPIKLLDDIRNCFQLICSSNEPTLITNSENDISASKIDFIVNSGFHSVSSGLVVQANLGDHLAMLLE